MASHDGAWDVFREEFRSWSALRGMTNKQLAQRLNDSIDDTENPTIDEHAVKRWRHATAPPLGLLRHIAATLEMSSDPTGQAPHEPDYLLRRMGLLADSADGHALLDTTHRLQDLRLRLMNTRAALSEETARYGSSQLVQLGLRLGYAAAAFPVWEGPVGYSMHAADRLDFRSIKTESPCLEEDPVMLSALADHFAVPGHRVPRFSTSQDDLDQQSHWAIPLIGRPFAQSGHLLHPGFPVIAVSSMTPHIWPEDLACAVAWLLGYGAISTREIVRELTNTPFAADTLRNQIHGQFLHTAPEGTVWAHHSTELEPGNPYAPWAAADGTSRPMTVHVRLVEDDTLIASALAFLSEQKKLTPEQVEAQLLTTRRQAAENLEKPAMAAIKQRTLIIPMTYMDEPEDHWTQALTGVVAVMRFLQQLGMKGDLSTVHERFMRNEPEIAPNMLRWLADNDCPFVSQKYATRSV